MGNTIQGVATKMLTLVPILVAIYFYDLPRFLTSFESAGLLSFFVLAISLFALGVALKRKILAVRLELSRVSFTWGLGLLALAVLLYVYGSYSGDTVWYHYESLYVLVIAYVALRIGTGILRALAPLLAIFTFSFLPVGFYPDLFHQELVVFLSADIMFILFWAYVGLRLFRATIIPVVLLELGVLSWDLSLRPLPFESFYLDLLIPLPLLVLFVPRAWRFASLPRGAPTSPNHEHRLLWDGFCSVCGLKLSPARTPENVGFWGLLAVLGVAALILFSTVPALAVVDKVPYDAQYTASGYTSAVTPTTPSGWQVNSTFSYPSGSNSYAIKQVYVPVYHPETENYTMYYELAPFQLVSNGPGGSDIPGFNTSSIVDTQFGPFQGTLTAYTASGNVMLAYQGRTTMLFLSGSEFQEYYVGVGFSREFENTNVSSATRQFEGDLNDLWLPLFTTDVAYSTWTATLYALDQAAVTLGPFLVLAVSAMSIGWFAYRATRSDDRLDRFLTLASAQPVEYWSYLSRLSSRSHRMGTGDELSLAATGTQMSDAERIDSSLRELERRRLVRRALLERGADIVSVWRPAF